MLRMGSRQRRALSQISLIFGAGVRRRCRHRQHHAKASSQLRRAQRVQGQPSAPLRNWGALQHGAVLSAQAMDSSKGLLTRRQTRQQPATKSCRRAKPLAVSVCCRGGCAARGNGAGCFSIWNRGGRAASGGRIRPSVRRQTACGGGRSGRRRLRQRRQGPRRPARFSASGLLSFHWRPSRLRGAVRIQCGRG